MKSMRFLTIVLVLFSFFTIAAEESREQVSDYNVDGWKIRYASPSYGISLLMLDVSSDDVSETIVVPGFDFRILNGVNVSKRGGFYTGYEVGATIYALSESDSFYLNDDSLNVHLAGFFAGTVYIMQKYGYRLDLGGKAGGLSLGPEIGIGIQVGGGSYDIIDDSDGEEIASGGTETPFGMLMELTLEGTLRMGQNTRLFAGLGANVSNPMFDSIDGGSFNSLDIEQLPVRPFLRGGFSMNY